LKNQTHAPGQALFGKQRSDPKGNGCVGIVSTGVHDPRITGFIRDIIGFLQGKASISARIATVGDPSPISPTTPVFPTPVRTL
jgi:hypothetical protein